MLKTHIAGQIYAKFPFEATFSQKKVVEKLSDWLISPNYSSIFVLNGYAGTGKTTLVAAVVAVLKDLGINIVEIDFDLTTNTVFAPGIDKADHNIIPNDEVVVVRDDTVVGVGKAVMTGREMEECGNGIGVKLKHRLKK